MSSQIEELKEQPLEKSENTEIDKAIIFIPGIMLNTILATISP